jgi:hypothetical protein
MLKSPLSSWLLAARLQRGSSSDTHAQTNCTFRPIHDAAGVYSINQGQRKKKGPRPSVVHTRLSASLLQASTVDMQPLKAVGGSTSPSMQQHPLALPPCLPFGAPTAHSSRRDRERGVPHGNAAETLRHPHHVRVKFGLDTKPL